MAVQLNLAKEQCDCILEHENAPAHKAISVKQFPAKNKVYYWNGTLILFP
jgi:hypothetical protein